MKDDNDDEEGIRDEEEGNPTRLLVPSQLEKLRVLIKNRYFIRELEQAPINKYPHLLFFALRAILDTLGNILENPRNPRPESLNASVATSYLGEHQKKHTEKVKYLIDKLAAHAHDARKQSSMTEINNNRDQFQLLIENMIKEYEKKKLKSKRDKK